MIPTRFRGPLVEARATEAVATTVKAGQFVSWAASKGEARGMVVSVHKANRVPGVPHVQEATPDAPAARVQLFAKSGKQWEATTAYLGMPVASLTAIADLPLVSTTEAVVPGSFDEIRQLVRSAICDRIEALTGVKPDLWIYDIGATWAVYCVGYSGDDLMLVDYTIDAGAATIGDPVEVRPVTSYHMVVEEATESVVDELGARVIEAAGEAADGGRIFQILMIAYGDSLNHRRYPESVMRAAAPLYEGAKAYDHHRTSVELSSGTISGLIGTFRKVTATAVGLEAELHLLPSATHAAEALDMALANQAEGLDPLIGVSQDVMARWKPISVNGRPMQEAVEITSVLSVDVVAHPAAGGKATRMVASSDPTQATTPKNKETHPVNLKQLLALLRAAESDAQRTALLQEHARVLETAGFTADEALAAAATPVAATETVAPAAGAPTQTTETVIAKGSIGGRLIVATAVQNAGLGEHMVESIMGELPAQFTEAELVAKVASTTRLLEHFEKQGLAPTVQAGDPKVTADALDKKKARLDQMLAGNFREGYQSLKAAYLDIAPDLGLSVKADQFSEALNRSILRESNFMNISGGREAYDSQRATESATSTTWGELLGDSITRRVVAEYGLPALQSWRRVVSSIVPLTDFRTQRIGRMGGYGVLPTVAQGAPYQPLTTPTDEEATYAPTKRGGTEDLTLETIANDDIRAVVGIPQKLGRAAAQTLYRFVWDFFDTNPNIYDSVAFFAAGHNNTATNALSGANLSAARKAMRKQTAYGDASELLSFAPRLLVVCSDLEEIAFQLATSAVALPSGAPVGAASNTPNLHAGIEPIVVDYWSSTTKWFTVADPAMVPTIELGFYGSEDPALFVQNDPTNGSAFNADKVTYKIRHVYGGGVLDYRGAYRGNT